MKIPTVKWKLCLWGFDADIGISMAEIEKQIKKKLNNN